MKKITLTFIANIIIAFCLFSQKGTMKFEKTTHNFGTIKEEAGFSSTELMVGVKYNFDMPNFWKRKLFKICRKVQKNLYLCGNFYVRNT